MKKYVIPLVVSIVLAVVCAAVCLFFGYTTIGGIAVTVIPRAVTHSTDGNDLLMLGEYYLSPVQSDSMQPEFSAGDLIFVQKTRGPYMGQDPEHYRVDDIIVYTQEQENGEKVFIASRVKQVSKVGFTIYTVLGDNTDLDRTDGQGENVFAYRVFGHYTGTAIPHGVEVMETVSTPQGFVTYLVITVVAALITVASAYLLILCLIFGIICIILLLKTRFTIVLTD